MLLKSILLINISFTLSHKYLLIETQDEKKAASVQANAVRANRRGTKKCIVKFSNISVHLNGLCDKVT